MPYEGVTIEFRSQSAGQQLSYSYYTMQLAGGNNQGMKGSAQIHKLFDNLGKKFYLKPGNNTESIIYCSVTGYEHINIWKPTESGTIHAEFVDSLPSDVELVSPAN